MVGAKVGGRGHVGAAGSTAVPADACPGHVQLKASACACQSYSHLHTLSPSLSTPTRPPQTRSSRCDECSPVCVSVCAARCVPAHFGPKRIITIIHLGPNVPCRQETTS